MKEEGGRGGWRAAPNFGDAKGAGLEAACSEGLWLWRAGEAGAAPDRAAIGVAGEAAAAVGVEDEP
jgi:hypothetical protein